MKLSEKLTVLSQVINFLVFIYFILELMKINALETQGLLISALALLISIIVNIIGVYDK
ncbi:MAG: hypothetical protein KJ600_06625 [Nanoarchaeota archaeon]|nr:hypothetical protein [Nanoarchaeota archaeon]MBU1104198.1 hypothetical protein [Nanoarchaeota archaeon]